MHSLLLKFATARKNKSRESLPSKNLNNVKLHELPTFSLEELATATNNFQVANMLGRGGFGTVYKVMVALVAFISSSLDHRDKYLYSLFLLPGKVAWWTGNSSEKIVKILWTRA